MAGGCRDCNTCTKPGIVRGGQALALGLIYLCTIGMAYMIKKGFLRHCPQCGHMMSHHGRRPDGSFID